jgi:myo-inositol-1-phosphate synthase
MSTIRVAIAGVGNCASSLVQGVDYYRQADPTETVPGLMHVELGGYHVGDLEFVAAFDADAAKVGLDLGKAIFAGQNNTIRFAGVGELGITVQRGPTLDGFGKYYRETVEESPAEPVDVVAALKDARADVLVSYLPVGSEQAQRFYADACLQAGVGFVNAIPVFIASDPEWARKFHAAGLPIVGDDIKSQVGSTIIHRILTRLFEDRGLALDHTYQLNVGGNMDFKNMLERERLESKKVSKTQAVTSQIEHGALSADDVHIGPSDHVPWLHDRKWAYIRMEGRNFGDVPLNLELKLEVWGLPQLGRRDHRRGPVRQAGPRPWHRRPAGRALRLFHEVAAGAVPRRRGPRHGGVLRRRRPPVRSGPTPDRSGRVPPPLGQSSPGLLLPQWPLLEPQLEEVGQGPADVAPRGQAELVHHLGPVEVGADGIQLLLLA